MIAWDDVGTGSPAVVFVHGLSEDRLVWSHVVELVQEHTRCICLDLRGHGDSPRAADMSGGSMVADVTEAIAAAGIDEPPVVVGHSLGGSIVTMHAAAAPAHAVVNVDQPMRFGDFARSIRPYEAQLRGTPDEFVRARIEISLALGRPANLTDVDRARLDTGHRSADQDDVLSIWGAMLEWDPDDLTAFAESLMCKVQVPYVEVHGEDRGEGYVQWLRELVPSARVEVWPGNGHYPHLGEPARLAELIVSLRTASEAS